jgi:hypothetical protein
MDAPDVSGSKHSSNEHCKRHQCILLLFLIVAMDIADIISASKLYFRRPTYVQKANETIFPLQLILYTNSPRINENHRNNVLIVATYILTPSVLLLF